MNKIERNSHKQHNQDNHHSTTTTNMHIHHNHHTNGEKIVETLYSNRVTSENKWIHTPPHHSKLGCLLFSIGGSNSGTTLHWGDGGGRASFSPFEVRKTSESPFRTKCLNKFCRRLTTNTILTFQPFYCILPWFFVIIFLIIVQLYCYGGQINKLRS